MDEPLCHCVVGSGPAGVACAKGLLARGATVRMLDAGIALEPERARLVEGLRETAREGWSAEKLAFLKEGMSGTSKGIPQKRVFGSDFPYRDWERHAPAEFEGVGLRPSLARGGLGNVWGATMMPYRDEDLAGWPIRAADLAEHYRSVVKFTGLSARRDDLEQFFPIHSDEPRALDCSRQARRLLQNLQRHQRGLAERGIYFGQARLAMQVAQNGQGGCVYCGLCMYGCPYGYIYNSADTLRELQGHRRFTYQGDSIVSKVVESGEQVVIEGYNRVTGEPVTTNAARVYLGAGVIPTTQILLRSMGLYDETVLMKDSQYFLLPMALARSSGSVRGEACHTLSQVFVDIFDKSISDYTVHLQVYSFNDLMGQAVAKAMGPLAKPLSALAEAIENRLLLIGGYLHSDDSAGIEVALKRSGGSDRLWLSARPNAQTRRKVGRIIGKLLRNAGRFGAVPLPPMLQMSEPGRGFHSGGTFPMSAKPAGLESDRLGRPRGWERVHAVDASVFPTIPATTITFSVMANAHRIGWETGGSGE